MTFPGPHGCPCWQCVGNAHQSGSDALAIRLLERVSECVPWRAWVAALESFAVIAVSLVRQRPIVS